MAIFYVIRDYLLYQLISSNSFWQLRIRFLYARSHIILFVICVRKLICNFQLCTKYGMHDFICIDTDLVKNSQNIPVTNEVQELQHVLNRGCYSNATSQSFFVTHNWQLLNLTGTTFSIKQIFQRKINFYYKTSTYKIHCGNVCVTKPLLRH